MRRCRRTCGRSRCPPVAAPGTDDHGVGLRRRSERQPRDRLAVDHHRRRPRYHAARGVVAGSRVRLAGTAGRAGRRPRPTSVGVASVRFSQVGTVDRHRPAVALRGVGDVPADAQLGSVVAFTARATDFAGNAADATATVTVVAAPDTTPPTVTLTAPAAVPEGAAFDVEADGAGQRRRRVGRLRARQRARHHRGDAALSRAPSVPSTTRAGVGAVASRPRPPTRLA